VIIVLMIVMKIMMVVTKVMIIMMTMAMIKKVIMVITRKKCQCNTCFYAMNNYMLTTKKRWKRIYKFNYHMWRIKIVQCTGSVVNISLIHSINHLTLYIHSYIHRWYKLI
jgi:hypothetical protein